MTKTARLASRHTIRTEVAAASRRPNEAGYGALAPHFRLLELGSGNRPVEGGAQSFGRLQGELDPGPRPGFEIRVDEVERDDVAERRMARMVIGNHRLRKREPFVAALCHALRARNLDNGCAHVRASYFARCLPKKANTLLQPSIACSGR